MAEASAVASRKLKRLEQAEQGVADGDATVPAASSRRVQIHPEPV